MGSTKKNGFKEILMPKLLLIKSIIILGSERAYFMTIIRKEMIV